MADTWGVIHQIEYRWQHVKDLSPFASTMPQQETAAWDDQIRGWVRHPHADRLAESLCYQILVPTGAAALAWRFRASRAAEYADGRRGRPLVSRVLIGHASLLTPEVAIMLCLTGLPPSARPGQVMAQDELPTISPGELTTLVNDQAAELDLKAAQTAGLEEVVAAALSDPDSPLAIYLPEDFIVKPVRKSPQGLLLWGLHRIMRQLSGTGRRSWSFSTFEPPLGTQGTATIPDIVFRQALVASASAGMWRKEAKIRPFDSDALADMRAQDVDMARRLVTAYKELGAFGIERFTTANDGPDEPGDMPHPRGEEKLRDVSSDRGIESPSAIVTESATPFLFVPSDHRPDTEVESSGEAVPEPQATVGPSQNTVPPATIAFPATPPPSAEMPGLQDPADVVLDTPRRPEWEQRAQEVRSWERQRTGRHHKNWEDIASSRAAQASPPLILGEQRQRPTVELAQPDQGPSGQDDYRQSGTIGYLLRRMQQVGDPAAMLKMLRTIVTSRVNADSVERQEARRIMAEDGWFESISKNVGLKLDAHDLARIFRIIVIPDLGKIDVSKRIGDWADHADPEMIGGLLIAANDAGLKDRAGFKPRLKKDKDPADQVRQLLLPGLAGRWAREKGISMWWADNQPP